MSTNAKVRYVEADQFFVVDLSSKMNKRILAYRAKVLRDCLKDNLKYNKVVKILFDFRNVEWDSEETHYMARQILSKYSIELHGYQGFGAMLNDHYDGQTSEHEAFFTKERDALDWLGSR